jgi:hypothetical protein
MQDIETEIYKRYESELAAIAEQDRAYYLNPTPTSAERADYVTRQDYLEQARALFYEKVSTARRSEGAKPGLFRVLIDDRLIGRPVVSAPQCMLIHDLNNHLGVVIERCQLLFDYVSHDVEAARQLSLILDVAHQMAERIHGSVCPRGNSASLPK